MKAGFVPDGAAAEFIDNKATHALIIRIQMMFERLDLIRFVEADGNGGIFDSRV